MIKRTLQTTTAKQVFLTILLVIPLIGWPQQAHEIKKQYKVALVLSGGGAKGFAHIGVLKVLEEEGIPVDLIVGTSMGGLVGGIYSIGYTASELETLVKSLDWDTVLTDDVPREFLSKMDQELKQRYIFSLPMNGEKKPSLPQGLIKGQNVLNIFCGLAGNVPFDADFQKFPVPFACVATNMETGKEVVLKNGFLPTAMYSSMAIPIAFQPSYRDGQLLVDGGLVNNFPTDVAKALGADIIIGVDIRNDFYDRKNLKSMNNILSQLVSFFDQDKDSVNNSLCDLIIHPDITGFSISSFNNEAVDTLIERGEKATYALKQKLEVLKSKYQLEPRAKSRDFVKPESWHITGLQFSGNYHLNQDFLLQTLDLKIPGNYSYEEIKTAINRLYGLGGFDRIYFNLFDAQDGKILNLNISTEKIFSQNIGFKANTTDAAAILINSTQKNYTNVFGLLSVSAELSVNPSVSILAETNKTNFPTIGIDLKGKYQNYNVFAKGNKILEANVFYGSSGIYLYKPFLRQFNFELGLREEYFKGDVFSKSDTYQVTSDVTDAFITNAYSFLTFDSMDDYYFPKKGTNLYAEFSLISNLHKTSNIKPIALLKMRNVIPLDQNTALLLDIYGRALFDSETPTFKMTLIGGEPYSQYFNYHLPFVGLQSVNSANSYAYIGLVGLRFNVAKEQYLSFLFNSLVQDSDMLLRDGSNVIYGGGIRYSLKTKLGPLDMTLGYSGAIGKPTFAANFGYWF